MTMSTWGESNYGLSQSQKLRVECVECMNIVIFKGSLFTYNSTAKLIHEMIKLTRKFESNLTLGKCTNE